MKNLNELANTVYKLASGNNAPAEFVVWFNNNEAKFNLSEDDFKSISRNTLNTICDLAEEAGFTF